jgi:hypothetical protein
MPIIGAIFILFYYALRINPLYQESKISCGFQPYSLSGGKTAFRLSASTHCLNLNFWNDQNCPNCKILVVKSLLFSMGNSVFLQIR